MIVPHRTPSFLPFLFPSSLIWRYRDAQRDLYLTFDDGPVDGPTDFVIETLASFGAKATFFCIGDNIRKHKSVFEKVFAGGHAVGNHTYNHLNGWRTDTKRYIENTKECESLLEEAGPRVKLFRPPYGRISRDQIRHLADYKIIMWDVLSVDYNKNLASEKCLSNTIKATRAGSIIVFHDSFKAEKNLFFALPRFLEHFKSKDFNFKIIT